MASKSYLQLCLLLMIQTAAAAQTADTSRIGLIRQVAALQNIRSGNNGLLKNSNWKIPPYGRPSSIIAPFKNTNSKPIKLSRPIPSMNTPVGINTTCFDTSLLLGYSNGGKWFAPAQLTKTRDGNLLIPGFEYDTLSGQIDAHLIKCTQQGDTIWSRLIRGGFPGYLVDVYEAYELADNSILLAGDIGLKPMEEIMFPVDLFITSATGPTR